MKPTDTDTTVGEEKNNMQKAELEARSRKFTLLVQHTVPVHTSQVCSWLSGSKFNLYQYFSLFSLRKRKTYLEFITLAPRTVLQKHVTASTRYRRIIETWGWKGPARSSSSTI